MPSEVSCPRCGQPVDSQVRQCPSCGIDLALAAVLAEQVLTSSLTPLTSAVPLAPEILVPRLGQYLIEKGVLKPEDLQRTLTYHKQCIDDGHPRLLGSILLEWGLVTRETLDQAITEQILSLQDALRQSNHQLEERVQERTIELQRALSRLSELNELKSNFISNISHELRTPLTHLKGYLSLLADGSLGVISPEQKEAFDVVMRAETRLEQLIEDLIQFALAARSELSLNLGSTSVNELVQVTITKVNRLAKGRNITLTATLADGLPLVRVDGEKIAWVLYQLLDNAIKFTHQGGMVKIEATPAPGFVTIGVVDTGIGISPDKVDEIFEPFHQLDSSDTRRYGGVGLGLALVKRIIEAHGSHIRVYSQKEKGSRFEFLLPVANGQSV